MRMALDNSGWGNDNVLIAVIDIRQVKNKEGKLVWPEPHDFRKGKRRFKSDLVRGEFVIKPQSVSEIDLGSAAARGVRASRPNEGTTR